MLVSKKAQREHAVGNKTFIIVNSEECLKETKRVVVFYKRNANITIKETLFKADTFHVISCLSFKEL